MIKEIKYNGFTSTPSDYECPDGDLVGAANLIPEDGGQLNPILPPSVVIDGIDADWTLLVIHNVPLDGARHDNYIFFDADNHKLIWQKYDDTQTDIVLPEDVTSITQVTPVGNTLVILTNLGIYYILWKDDDYTILGNQLPQLSALVKLDTTFEKKAVTINTASSTEGVYYTNDGMPSMSGGFSGTITDYSTYDEQHHFLEFTLSMKAASQYIFPLSSNFAAGNYRFYIMFPNMSWDIWDGITTELHGIRADNQEDVTLKTDNEYNPFGNQERNHFFYITTDTAYASFYFVVSDNHMPGWLNGRDASSSDWSAYTIEVQTMTTTAKPSVSEESMNQLLGDINTFIADQQKENNFLFPFFVRFGLRLFDDSVVCPTPPCLVIPNTNGFAIYMMTTTAPTNGGHYSSYLTAMAGKPTVTITNATALEPWKDIVKELVIAATPSLFTRKINPTQDEMAKESDISDILFVKHLDNTYSLPQSKSEYKKYQLFSLFSENVSGYSNYGYQLNLPAYTNQEVVDNITKLPFKVLNSIGIDKVTNNAAIAIEPRNFKLSDINTAEDFPENTASLNAFAPSYSYSFNNRLHIAGYEEQKTIGFAPEGYNAKAVQDTNSTLAYRAKVTLSDGQQTIAIATPLVISSSYCPFVFLSGAGAEVKSAVIYREINSQYYSKSELQLFDHPLYDGKFFFAVFAEPNFTSVTETEWDALDELPSTATFTKPNYLKVSEVNNPYTFSNQRTFPFDGDVLALATAAQALSQGQFGEFPLYVFTKAGIWSLKVNSTGSYDTQHPIARDVLLSPRSLCQLDGSVLFATERGIMELAGSSVKCITSAIDLDAVATNLPNLSGISNNSIATPTIPFREYIKDCRILYDYIGQRVLIYNPNPIGAGSTIPNYAYVLSFKSGKWGIGEYQIKYHVDAYPNALAIIEDATTQTENALVNFSDPVTDPDVLQGVKGTLITRPIKLDYPDALKTIDTVIQRGYFKGKRIENGTPKDSHVKCILYGSRDLFNWHFVWSSNDQYLRGFRGTPYKYFRIVLICDLDPEESIYGCTIQYTPRLTNQPR